MSDFALVMGTLAAYYSGAGTWMGAIGAWVGALATVILAVAAWQARTTWRQQIELQRGQAIAEDLVAHGRAVMRCIELMYYPYEQAQERLRMQPYPQETQEEFQLRMQDGWREQTYLDHIAAVDGLRTTAFRAGVVLDPSFEALATVLLDGIDDIRKASREMAYFRRSVTQRPQNTLRHEEKEERARQHRHIEGRMWSGAGTLEGWKEVLAELEGKCRKFIRSREPRGPQ